MVLVAVVVITRLVASRYSLFALIAYLSSLGSFLEFENLKVDQIFVGMINKPIDEHSVVG